VGKEARSLAESAESLQIQLGDHHDAVIAEAWLPSRAQGASSMVAFSAGLLACERIRREQVSRQDGRTGLEKIDRRARDRFGLDPVGVSRKGLPLPSFTDQSGGPVPR
jgi:hypothetical protein